MRRLSEPQNRESLLMRRSSHPDNPRHSNRQQIQAIIERLGQQYTQLVSDADHKPFSALMRAQQRELMLQRSLTSRQHGKPRVSDMLPPRRLESVKSTPHLRSFSGTFKHGLKQSQPPGVMSDSQSRSPRLVGLRNVPLVQSRDFGVADGHHPLQYEKRMQQLKEFYDRKISLLGLKQPIEKDNNNIEVQQKLDRVLVEKRISQRRKADLEKECFELRRRNMELEKNLVERDNALMFMENKLAEEAYNNEVLASRVQEIQDQLKMYAKQTPERRRINGRLPGPQVIQDIQALKQYIEGLEGEIKELRIAEAKTFQQRQSLKILWQQEQNNRNMQTTELQAKMQILEAKLTAITSQSTQFRQYNQQLVADLTQQVKKLSSVKTELETRRATMEASIKSDKDYILKLQKTVSNLQRSNEDALKRIEDYKSLDSLNKQRAKTLADSLWDAGVQLTKYYEDNINKDAIISKMSENLKILEKQNQEIETDISIKRQIQEDLKLKLQESYNLNESLLEKEAMALKSLQQAESQLQNTKLEMKIKIQKLQDELTEKNSEINKLVQAEAKQTEEINKLTEQEKNLQITINSIEKQNQYLLSKYNQMTIRKAQQEQELSKRMQMNQSLKFQNEERSQMILGLQAELQTALQNESQIKREKERLMSDNAVLEQKLKEIKDSIMQLKVTQKALVESLARTEEKVSALQSEKARLLVQVEEGEMSVAELRTELDAIGADLQKMNQEYTVVQQALQQTRASLEESAQQNRHLITDLKATLNQLDEQVSTNQSLTSTLSFKEAQLAHYQQIVEENLTYRKRLAELSQQSNAAEQRIVILEESIGRSQAELRSQTQENTKVKSQIEGFKQEIVKLREEIITINAKYREVLSEKEMLQSRFQTNYFSSKLTAESELLRVNKNNNNLKQNMEFLQDELSKVMRGLNAANADAEQARNSLRQQQSKYKEQQIRHNKAMDRMKETVDRLNEEIRTHKITASAEITNLNKLLEASNTLNREQREAAEEKYKTLQKNYNELESSYKESFEKLEKEMRGVRNEKKKIQEQLMAVQKVKESLQEENSKLKSAAQANNNLVIIQQSSVSPRSSGSRGMDAMEGFWSTGTIQDPKYVDMGKGNNNQMRSSVQLSSATRQKHLGSDPKLKAKKNP